MQTDLVIHPMDLLTGYNSSDDSTDNDDKSEGEEKQLRSQKTHLPSADSVLQTPLPSSVFKNIYESETYKNEAVLEKHVKMVENKQNLSQVNGKQVCWMFRRGKCRFGKNCNMFHDSDLRSNFIDEKKISTEKNTAEGVETISDQLNIKFSESQNIKSKKKRPGLTNSLIPSKRALKNIKRVQSLENTQKKP
ncbi:uncharacterized protein LOC143466256 isoform X1 [Clavelina lepadiformis]|uniref:uncharacterized protein LOC143466256 isoform X1 n=1 Tax=Clavelina lepadiformis TaxID=159417 RepID=UPI0040413AFE